MSVTTIAPVITVLTGREPGTPDYERARSLLVREFRYGGIAAVLLRRYRDRELDLAIETIETPDGDATRLVMTTGFTRHKSPEMAGSR